jgi:Methyltransferase domain
MRPGLRVSRVTCLRVVDYSGLQLVLFGGETAMNWFIAAYITLSRLFFLERARGFTWMENSAPRPNPSLLFTRFLQSGQATVLLRQTTTTATRPGRRKLPLVLVSATDHMAAPSSSGDEGAESVLPTMTPMIRTFLSHVQTAIDENCLHTFTLKGPALKKALDQDSRIQLRGCIRAISGRPIVLQAKKIDSAVRRAIQVTFKYHGATDICKNWDMTECVANLEAILASPEMPLLPTPAGEGAATGLQHGRDLLPAGIGVVPPSEWNNGQIVTTWGHAKGIQGATMQTTTGIEWSLAVTKSRAGKILSIPATKLSHRKIQPTPRESLAENQRHDRKYMGLVNVSAPVWQALGVTTVTRTATGDIKAAPKANMASKLRQCQKFVEIVHRLIAECESTNDVNAMEGETMTARNQYPWDRISVVDMGCGRGYITFALHSFLYQTVRESNVLVSSRGIDVRPKLVNEVSAIASSLGAEFRHLQFETGTIESFLAECQAQQSDQEIEMDGDATKETSLSVFIALHACDTATDDALWSAVSRKANVIVVAPCCHQQVRPQLNAAATNNPLHPYADILKHNIYRERIAETVTDSLRALLLELNGLYKVQVFEFIGGEHTSKNVMITAVRRNSQHVDIDKTDRPLYQSRLNKIRALAELHGVRNHKLAEWMGVNLLATMEGNAGSAHMSAKRGLGHQNPLRMPPIKTGSS